MLLKYFNKYHIDIRDAHGVTISLNNGKDLIDISGSLGYNSLGHGWLRENISVPCIMKPNFLFREKEQELSDLLCRVFGYDYSFVSNTGHEVVEIFLQMNKDKKIWKFCDGFHGRTQSIKSIPSISETDTVLGERDALIFEPFSGYLGEFNKLSEERVEFIKRCKENGCVLCADEIQTSFYKVGHLLASSFYGIKPDIVTLGKSLGQGLPISAILTNTDNNFMWSSTFAGNEIACDIGIKSVKEHQKRGSEFFYRSCDFEHAFRNISKAYGFSGTLSSNKTFQDFVDSGVLLSNYRLNPTKFKFLCPPIIMQKEIKEAYDRILAVIGR